MTKRTSGKLPPADYYEAEPAGFDIFSWCPTPEPTVPPTQVHLHVRIGRTGRVIVRFKGPDTLDRLIAALSDHRREVFGEPPK